QMLFDYMGPIVAVADKQLLLEAGILVPVEFNIFDSNIEVSGKTFKHIETNLTENKARNELLFRIIQKEYNENENNYIVLLTARRNHVELLHEMCLQNHIPALKMMGGKLKKEEEARIEQ